jgi:hypothetical protein
MKAIVTIPLLVLLPDICGLFGAAHTSYMFVVHVASSLWPLQCELPPVAQPRQLQGQCHAIAWLV